MNFREAKQVITQDVSSGKVHTRVYESGRMLTDERCQADQSGAFRIIDTIDGIEPAKLCRRCFLQPENDEVPE